MRGLTQLSCVSLCSKAGHAAAGTARHSSGSMGSLISNSSCRCNNSKASMDATAHQVMHTQEPATAAKLNKDRHSMRAVTESVAVLPFVIHCMCKYMP